MAAREFLYIVTESAYGTAKASPVLGTDAIYIWLDDTNSFTMVGDPEQYEIGYGGGFAVPAVIDSDQISCVGQLTTKLCGSQAVFLSNWFAQRINAGQTSPWTTTEPPGDLASCSVYHGVARSDGTIKRLRFAGTKVTSWEIACSRQAKHATLNLGLQAQKYVGNPFDSSSDPNSTEFPAPAESAYPRDVFKFVDLAGNFTIGSSRTNFSEISIKCQNAHDPRWFESRFLALHRVLGRKTTLDATLLYKPSPDDLTSYQQLTAQTGSIEFSNGTNTLTIGFNSKSKITKATKKLDTPKVYEIPITFTNLWDATAAAGAGADLTVTAT